MMNDVQFNPETGEILDPPAAAPVQPNGPVEQQKPRRRRRAPPKRTRPPIPADETKRQKFVRLVDPRVSRAIAAIRRIGKLGGANSSNYEFGQDDVDKIVAALSHEVTRLDETMVRGRQASPAFSIEDA